MTDHQALFNLHNTLLKKFYLTNREQNENLIDKYWDCYYFYSSYFHFKPTKMSPQVIKEIFSDIFLATLPYVKHYFSKYSSSQKITMLTMLKKIQYLDKEIFEVFFNELATEYTKFKVTDNIKTKFTIVNEYYLNKEQTQMVEL